jgi:hypothetical protein
MYVSLIIELERSEAAIEKADMQRPEAGVLDEPYSAMPAAAE